MVSCRSTFSCSCRRSTRRRLLLAAALARWIAASVLDDGGDRGSGLVGLFMTKCKVVSTESASSFAVS